MTISTSSDDAILQIRSFKKVAVLLYSDEDELCARARGSLSSCEDRLRGLGFSTLCVEVCPRSTQSDELACVRVPQLRLFSQGKLIQKLIGSIDDYSIDSLLRDM